MTRCLEREWLDELPATDPQAEGSRRDLRLLNWCMGNTRVLARALSRIGNQNGPGHLTELGAGDGTFLLRVARALGPQWAGTRATLLDRQAVIARKTLLGFAALAWHVNQLIGDVFDQSHRIETGSMVVTNLFLHHFNSQQIQILFGRLAPEASLLIAIEPRRSVLSLIFSKWVGLIGCNAVTRHDAPASVRAGFRGTELSTCWPQKTGWLLEERVAGPFSHLFIAKRAPK